MHIFAPLSMLTKRIIHILLIVTLVIQLFPTNQAGRFFCFDLPDEEYTDLGGAKGNQLRQLTEEEKDLHIDHTWEPLCFVNAKNNLFHFSERLPIPHPGAIPTPPPNALA